MTITIHLTDAEASLLLRLLEAERTMPQLLLHEAMNPKEDPKEWDRFISRLIDKFSAMPR